jgi:peroxiredoxin Q/BCP
MRVFSPMRVSALAAALTLLAVFCLLIVAPAARAGDPPKAIDPPKVGDTAPGFELEALGGGKVKLDTLLTKGPVVLVVLRGYPGYQCPYCTRQVGELIGRAKEFADASAEVVLVYPGPADGLKQHAGEFVQGKDIPSDFSLVLDPDFAFTDRYGLRWDAPHETSYPSTFVIDRKGKVVFAKISHTHGDRAEPDEILKALAKAAP